VPEEEVVAEGEGATPGGVVDAAEHVDILTGNPRTWEKNPASDPQREEPPMPTFVLLSTLTPEGVQTVKNNPSRIREVNKEVEQLGASVKAQWAVLGRFDFVNVIEAPDEQTMARVSLELGSRGTAHYESLPAIPIDDFIASL
jgi:uncharacterized protein with GYD domain